jgi:hypothetical protein
MDYKLYTTVDITHTGQYRTEAGKEELRWKEQNFQTVLQTLGIRGNVSFTQSPALIEISGKAIGFNTDRLINVWRFDFSTERDFLFEEDNDPVAALKSDFELVPFISGLAESMEQNYNVFVTSGPATNIVFHKKG